MEIQLAVKIVWRAGYKLGFMQGIFVGGCFGFLFGVVFNSLSKQLNVEDARVILNGMMINLRLLKGSSQGLR